MAGYDGEIRINTKIETADAKQQLMTLQNHMNKTAQKMDGITEKMADLKNAKVENTAEWKNLRSDIDAAKTRIQDLTEKAREMRSVRLPTEEYVEIQAHLQKAQKEFDKLFARQQRLQALGKTSGTGWESLKYDMEELGGAIEADKIDLQNLVEEGKAFSTQTGTDEYQKLKADLQAAYEEMRRLKSEEKELETAFNSDKTAGIDGLSDALKSAQNDIDLTKVKMQQVIDKEKEIKAEGFQKVGKAAEQASKKVKKLEKETSGAKKGFSNLANTMKQMVLSMAMFTVMQKGMEFLGSGLKNLAVYSKEYNKSMSELMSSMSQLKNAFAVAFQPILNIVIPILSQLISAVSTAANAVSRFFAILGGKSTYTKAIKQNEDYAASLGTVGDAADEAKGSLAGFDELEVMQKPNTGSGSGGSSTSGADGSGFIEEAVGDTTKFEKIKKVLGEIAELFKSGFMDGLGDWESRLADIQEKTQMIKKALTNIFTDPQVTAGAKTFAEALIYNIGRVAGSMASIGLTIAQNLIGGIATYLTENTERIKKHLITMFDIGTDIANMVGDFTQAFAYVFEAFGSENGQQLTANLIGIFADAFMGVTELCGKAVRDLLNIFIQPFVDNQEGFRTALEGFLGIAATVCGTIKTTIDNTFDKLNEVYDEHFAPFFNNIANGLSSITGKFLEFWNTYVQPMLEEMATKFDTLMSEHIQPMLNKAIELLGSVADLLNALWVNVLQPFIEWVIENILPVLIPIFDGLASGFMTVVGYIADAIGGIIDSFKGIIDFLVGVFTGDWEKAWSGISEWANGVWESLKGAFNAVITAIHTVMNAKLQLIKTVWTTVWNAVKTAAETVWNAIKGKIDTAITNIKTKISSTLSSISSNWSNVWNKMKTSVTTIFNNIWTNIKKVINNIIAGVEKMANAVVKGINAVITALNNLHFTMPDWLGGGSFGFNLTTLPSVSIPRLANGGITTGSTLANIGEAGKEAVLPLERNTEWMDTFAEVLAGKMGGTGQTINLTAELDGNVIYKRIVQLDQEFAGRTGSSRFSYGY